MWGGVACRKCPTGIGELATGCKSGGVVILIHLGRAAIDDPQVRWVRWIERDARWARGTGSGNRPATNVCAADRVLEHLVGRIVVDNSQIIAIGHDVLGGGVTAIQAKATGRDWATVGDASATTPHSIPASHE